MHNRALHWNGQALRLIHRPATPPPPDYARIKLRLAGICNTDIELMRGYYGFQGYLGHEFVGEVIAGPPEWMGERVTGEINISCGHCDMCERQMPTHCRNRKVLGITGGDFDGAFADSFLLPIANLHRVPDNIPDEAAVFTEPLAAACRIIELHPIQPSDRVIVIGAGKLGLLCAQVLQSVGADLTVIVRRERQSELLTYWGIPSADISTLPQQMADYVIDCSGNAEGFQSALNLVRPRGTIILKSTFNGLTPADFSAIAVREIRVEGSRCGSFSQALDLLAAQKIDPHPMIEAIYNLEHAPEAMQHAMQKGALKILLRP